MVRWKEIILLTVIIRGLLFLINPLIDNWVRWDSPHYIDIATNWYQTSGDPANFIVFYPLYPILIKFVGILTNNLNLAAIIISLICSIISSVLLYELALLDFSKRVALLSVWFLNIFPTSYFLQAGYTESLFLMLSLSSVYFYRTRVFPLSGITGLLSSLTRINGITLTTFYLFETMQNKISLRRITIFLLVSLLTGCGFMIYLLINFSVFRDFFYFTIPLSEHWYKKFIPPWYGIKDLVDFTSSQLGNHYFLFLGEILTIIFTFFLSFYTLFRIRISYGAYMFTNLFLFTATSFIMSTPRYVLILFPIYFCLARIENKILLSIISTIFIIMLITLTYLYTKGSWAY